MIALFRFQVFRCHAWMVTGAGQEGNGDAPGWFVKRQTAGPRTRLILARMDGYHLNCLAPPPFVSLLDQENNMIEKLRKALAVQEKGLADSAGKGVRFSATGPVSLALVKTLIEVVEAQQEELESLRRKVGR